MLLDKLNGFNPVDDKELDRFKNASDIPVICQHTLRTMEKKVPEEIRNKIKRVRNEQRNKDNNDYYIIKRNTGMVKPQEKKKNRDQDEE